jgi:hypothetical protein
MCPIIILRQEALAAGGKTGEDMEVEERTVEEEAEDKGGNA